MDPLTVAGLFGYSAAKDAVAQVARRVRNRKRTEFQGAANTFAFDTAICEVVGSYYACKPPGALRPYSLEFPRVSARRGTCILTSKEFLGLGPRQNEIGFKYLKGKVPDAMPPKIAKYAIEVSTRLQADQVVLENKPLYSLKRIEQIGPRLDFEFGISEFQRYRFSYGLLEDEVTDALVRVHGNTEAVRDSPDRYLPVRRILAPATRDIESVTTRLCAGGLGVLFAMARHEEQDFLLLIQVRSGRVSDSRMCHAVIPKAFHQPFVDAAAEVHISSSVYRETYEEIYSGEEARSDVAVLAPDWYFDKCPGVAYFRDHSNAFKNEIVAFGFNSLLGNYEFAVLLAIPDEWYWNTFRRAIEFSPVETRSIVCISSLDAERMIDILVDRNWAPESRFHFIESLLRLAELYPDRVRLPSVVRMVGEALPVATE